jgi:hypothetical protein
VSYSDVRQTTGIRKEEVVPAHKDKRKGGKPPRRSANWSLTANSSTPLTPVLFSEHHYN